MIQITALVENTSSDPRLGAEHGLSLYIETGAHRILFDMGQTALYAANARVLGVDLAGVDLAMLSHGHYDHGGGLAHFLAVNPDAPVYLSRYAFEPHYHGSTENVGLEPALAQSPRLRFTGETTPLGDGLTLYACNERPRRHDLGSFGLTTVRGGVFVAEDFRHEQYLLIEQEGKRVLISGCSHKGILDIVEWFRPDVLVGGFHFSELPLDETLAGYARALDRSGTVFYTCHCTGRAQYEFMKSQMDRLYYLSTGQSIRV